MDVWRPKSGTPAVLVRWLMTEWCNYRCPYCPQTHDRRAPKDGGMTAHAFDNFPLERWLDAFDRHFNNSRLSLVLTGGEPMVDRKNMLAFLNHMSSKARVECIRIDTNAWWKPEQFADLDTSKIILMCTFHPSQIDEELFIQRIESFLRAGFKIGMINYVMNVSNIQTFKERSKRFADLGVILHPNPLWGQGGSYAPADLALMRAVLPEHDYNLRSGRENPKGKLCNFPAIAYEMNYTGWIAPGCLYDRSGSFFAESLPAASADAAPCPFESCVCLDKYSFMVGTDRNVSTNPLHEYSKALWKQREELSRADLQTSRA